MTLTRDYVAKLFENLSNGETSVFFDSIIDDVHWAVMGTHPLADVYNRKPDFLKHTFERLVRLLKDGSVLMKVDHSHISGDTAIVDDFYLYCPERKTIHSKVPLGNTVR
jgi:uncharacterized protein